jgi:hypothetical protein
MIVVTVVRWGGGSGKALYRRQDIGQLGKSSDGWHG